MTGPLLVEDHGYVRVATRCESLAVEARIAGAHRPDHDQLDRRRREVLARNRSRL
jgi:hypothetical protein